MLSKQSAKDVLKWMLKIERDKESWEESYPILIRCLDIDEVNVISKSLWIIGEIGLTYPNLIDENTFKKVLFFMNHSESKVREKAVYSFGRIGRSNPEIVKQYIPMLINRSKDVNENVRMNMIWASENIARTSPEFFQKRMKVFSELLDDFSDKVRIEAPEIFRIIAMKHPEYLRSYKSKLKYVSENDQNQMVRLHAKGALKPLIKRR